MINSMSQLVAEAKENGSVRLAVAAAEDADVLTAVSAAEAEGLVNPILVGNEEKIRQIIAENNITFRNPAFVEGADPADSSEKSAMLVAEGKADVIMKGFVVSSVLLKAMLKKDYGLRGDGIISHDLLLEVPGYGRLLHVTDSAMNIAPDLNDKVFILKNAVDVAHVLGNECPKAAVLCAVEKVNPKMQATLDAQAITDMYREGKISGCIVDGPLALDNAISPEAAKHKEIKSEVAGYADILLCPTIESANFLNKSMEHFAHAKKAGVLVGAKVPVALTSRATSAESKHYTIALACLIAGRKAK